MRNRLGRLLGAPVALERADTGVEVRRDGVLLLERVQRGAKARIERRGRLVIFYFIFLARVGAFGLAAHWQRGVLKLVEVVALRGAEFLVDRPHRDALLVPGRGLAVHLVQDLLHQRRLAEVEVALVEREARGEPPALGLREFEIFNLNRPLLQGQLHGLAGDVRLGHVLRVVDQDGDALVR